MTTSSDLADRAAAALVFPVEGLAINPGGTLHAGALGAILELTGFLALLLVARSQITKSVIAIR